MSLFINQFLSFLLFFFGSHSMIAYMLYDNSQNLFRSCTNATLVPCVSPKLGALFHI